MTPATRKLLQGFATLANWNALGNPVDMERFWDFVISAYRNAEHDISLDEFLDVVGHAKGKEDAHGIKFFNKKRDLAAKMFMYRKYEDGVTLLRKFEGK